ncbi:MAG: hypothetical protein M3068_10005 [Gemmatimonadota bacterium]|nr:hypothetical protein [Gemmatimonadota bacterium]
MRSELALLATTLVLAACAPKQQHAEPQLAPLPSRPLAAFATRRVIVLPTHFLRPADSLGWAAQVARPREYLRSLDDQIAIALGERGVKSSWIFPEALARSARRNAGFAADPYALSIEFMRPPFKPAPERLLPDPFASQLRALVALNDARYALIPVELRFEPAGGGAGRAVLRVALVDARATQVVYMGDVKSDSLRAFAPALTASVAGHLADLIATP